MTPAPSSAALGCRVIMLVRNPCTHDARVLKEARTLADAGHEVVVVGVQDGVVPELDAREGFRIVRIPVRPLQAPLGRWWARVPATVRRALAPLERRLEGLRVVTDKQLLWLDYGVRCRSALRVLQSAPRPPGGLVLHAHDVNTLGPAYLAARAYGGRLVYDAHELHSGSAIVVQMNAFGRGVLRAWERALARRADAVITVNESLSAIIAHAYRVPAPVVVRNCPESAPAPADGGRLHRLLGIPAGMRIALYHGDLAPFRGIEQLLQSLRWLPHVAIVLLGSGTLARHIPRLAAELGVPDRVFMAPFVPREQLLEHIAGADVGVIPIQPRAPSYYFSLPNKLFECLMAGRPVAASRLPEIRRVVEEEGVGALFDPEQPREIARAIAAVLDAPDYPALCARARACALERHVWRLEAAKLLDLYGRLSDDKRAERPTSLSRPRSAVGTTA
jgi:glycosyltransferase involved in cell wall biosynthesis